MAKAKPNQPGAALGRMLSQLLADAVVGARAGILPAELAEKWKHNEAFMKSLERDGAPLFQAMFASMDGADTTPPGLQAFIDQAGGATHDIDWLLQIIGFLGSVLAILPALGQIEIRPFVQALNNVHQNQVLSPADLADAVMRGVDTGSVDPVQEASQSGINADRFSALVQLIGEPPGVYDMGALYRRGAIDDATMQEIFKYSRYNDKYYDEFVRSLNSYMSPADVIELAIKGVQGDADYTDMFDAAGGLGTQFQMLFEAAGDAIGNEQVLALYNQGLATYQDVVNTFGRSRMNPIFYPLAFNLRHKFLEPFQIGEMVAADPALADQATQWMLNLGYNAEQAAALIASKTKGATATVHKETEAMIVQMYIDQVLTADEAESALVNLGYDPGSASMILELADAKRALSQQTAAVGAVRSAYVAGKISHDQASMDLDQLEIPPAARDQWLAAWGVEASTKFKELTAAQVGSLAKKGVIGYQTAIGRWVAMGYGQADAELLAAEYGGGPLLNSDGTPVTPTP